MNKNIALSVRPIVYRTKLEFRSRVVEPRSYSVKGIKCNFRWLDFKRINET